MTTQKRIRAGITILLNTATNSTFIASALDEEVQTGTRENDQHIEWAGELSIPVITQEKFDEMEDKLESVLCAATGNLMSYSSYSKEDMLTRVYEHQQKLSDEGERLKELLNRPEINDFLEGFKIEAAHQTEKWGEAQEEQKPPHHYVLVANKLLGKIAVAIFDRNTEKFKHHLITLAASMSNCHRQIDKPGTVVHGWFAGAYHYGKPELQQVSLEDCRNATKEWRESTTDKTRWESDPWIFQDLREVDQSKWELAFVTATDKFDHPTAATFRRIR